MSDDDYCRDQVWLHSLGRYTMPCMRAAGHGPVTREEPHRDWDGMAWFPADAEDSS